MTLKIIGNSEDNLKFLTKDLDLCFINGIRRVIMGDIGGYAFDEIEIKKNTTIFHDEFLKHRIGLIPIMMDNQMTFECNYKNINEEDKYVLSNNLVSLDNGKYNIMMDIPIAVLSKNEELKFIAKTNKGVDNVKYSYVKDINFIKMRRIKKKDVVDEIREYMYKDLYYGREYLLKKNKISFAETSMYCIKINTIMRDCKSVLREGLKKLKEKMENMKNILISDLEVNNTFNSFKISGIDFIEASIFVNMLLKRDDVKIATYTKKHLLDKFFIFKLEFKEYGKDVFEVKGVEMEKVLKIIDKMIKDIK